MRLLLIIALAGCAAPVGKVCNPAGECAVTIAGISDLPPPNLTLRYPTYRTVTIDNSRVVVLVPY